MRLSCTPLSLATWFAFGATVAVAAPTVKPSGGAAQAQCPTPNKARCLEKGYLDSLCGQTHRAVCKPFVEEALEAHYKAKAAPKLKMLRPKRADMPKHVVQGKYFAYKKAPEVVKQGSVATSTLYRKVGDVLAGVAGMDMSKLPPVDRVTRIDPNEAAKFHRNPAWRDNGNAVRSCKEYAYARSYGAARFIDAASACRGDRECVFSVAYLNAPTGIARNALFDEDGVPMPRQLTLPKGLFPKNDMFTAGMEAFIFVPSVTMPNGLVLQDAEVAALKSTLKFGKDYYNLGSCTGASCNGKTTFKNVWDWHAYLHGKTAAISQNEAEEYERRRAKFRALIEQWGVAASAEAAMGKGIKLEQKIVLPFDMRARDPFERYEFEHEYIERGREARELFKQKFGPQILEMPRAQAIEQIHQKQGMQGAWHGGMAAGLLAAPAPTPKPKPKPATPTQAEATTGQGTVAAVEASQAFHSDTQTISKCLAPDGWGLEMAYHGPISCRIQEFLLAEWRRKSAGQKSCLDLGNIDCDWTLEMFETGLLAQVQALDVQVADESYCTAYLESNTFTDNPNNGGVSTVTVVKSRLDATKKRVEEELKEVSDYIRPRTDKGQPLGKDWNGGDYAGDKDWFAAGYDYGLGWQVGPATKNGNGLVCQLEGSIHGDVGFDAWIMGGKISVVDGTARVEASPSNGGRYKALLKMMGQRVFDQENWKSAQTFSPEEDTGFGVQVPGGLKPRFDIYVGVPISGQMWGELLFGTTLGMKTIPSGACSSEPNNPKFGLSAQYMPFFGAFGIGQVGVGIAGIASAGVRASLTLVMLGLPLDMGMQASIKNNTPTVSFSSQLGLMLATLSGRVSLYVEFLMFDEEFELFRWKGFSTQVPLMPKLTAKVSFGGLK